MKQLNRGMWHVTRNTFVLVLGGALLAAAGAVSAQDVVFQKCDLIDNRGKEVRARLVFSADKKAMLVEVADHPIADIPYGSVDKVSYEFTKRHRVKEGAVVMVASLGAGAVVMLTKSKSHWFYVDYHEPEGKDPKTLTLRLDKKEYKDILETATEKTGKQVEMLNDVGRSRKKKKNDTASTAPVAPQHG